MITYRLVCYSNYESLNIEIPSADYDYTQTKEYKRFLSLPCVKIYGIIRSYIHQFDKSTNVGSIVKYI